MFVEQEHFVKHKKGSSIKFKYTIEPFVASDNAALQIVEDILKGMNFKKAKAISYDPKGIIHQRTCQIRCGIFEHEEVAGLAQWENSDEVNEEIQLIIETLQIQSESAVPMQ